MSDCSTQIAGVYRIRNTVNGKVYIGSSKDVCFRLYRHLSSLAGGSHYNRHLQRAFNQCGAGGMELDLIDVVWYPIRLTRNQLRDKLLAYEQLWIDHYNASNPAFGYNLSPTANSTLGVKYTDESRAKISAKAIGRIPWTKGLTKEMDPRVAAYADKHRGYKFSEEDKAKMRGPRPHVIAWNKGKVGCWKAPPEWVEANRQRMLGHKFSAEHNEKISRALTGRVFSDEHRAHLKESQNKPETQAKKRAAMLGDRNPMRGKPSWNKGLTKADDPRLALTDEYKRKIAKASKASWADAKRRARQGDTMRGNHNWGDMAGSNNPMHGHSCTEFMTEEQIRQWKEHLSVAFKGKRPTDSMTEEAVRTMHAKMSENHADVSGERNPMHGVSPKERMTPEVYAGWRAHISESHRRAHINRMLREWS